MCIRDRYREDHRSRLHAAAGGDDRRIVCPLDGVGFAAVSLCHHPTRRTVGPLSDGDVVWVARSGEKVVCGAVVPDVYSDGEDLSDQLEIWVTAHDRPVALRYDDQILGPGDLDSGRFD